MNSRALLGLGATALLALLAGCPGTKYPNCKSTEDCNEDGHNGVCVNGTCQECASDRDCKAGFKCQANACVPAVACQSNNDCPSGQVCKNGDCVACTSDTECGTGSICSSGACQPKSECASDADCGDGRKCVDGNCQQTEVKCDIGPVRFELDSYALTEGSKTSLQQLADCLKASQKAAKVTIEGHADERGSDEYNQTLGDKRANAVKKFLVNLGVESQRLNTVSYGEERPVDSGHDEGAWSRNRRVDFVLAR